jgi:hypothetical protein
LAEYESANSFKSQRQVSEELGIPRATLQHWLSRREKVDATPELTMFIESPVGTAFLHQIIVAAHYSMTMSGPGSIRQVCQFLELSGLDRFVASSYGTQHSVSVQMEESIVDFGQEEKSRLSEAMKPKEIAICEDETFHPETCLVAIEPVSNFILLEKYADSRKSSEWTKAMDDATAELPVTIVQSVSDEGKGILHHVKSDLAAHHAPDVFHVQHEIVKGTSAVLASKKKKAELALNQANDALDRCIKEKEDYQPRPGRPPQFDKRIEAVTEKQRAAQQAVSQAESNQIRMKEAVRQIGRVYHPVDLETGKVKDTEEVSKALEGCFSEIEAVAADANLLDRSLKRIGKAKKVVVEMVATILFFHMTIRTKIEALSLPLQVETAVIERLIPGLYLKRVAKQAKTADERRRLRQKSSEILESLQGQDSPFYNMDVEELKVIEKVGEECAYLFQRSSSCVEGRNGQLSLRHHGLHRLSNRKLTALTAVHNYATKRPDGTTPAERFFGVRPRDLFDFLMTRIALPGRPSVRRV